MVRNLSFVVLAVLLVGLGPRDLSAQWRAGLPGEDLGSIAVHVGILAPTGDLPDGTTFESRNGLGVSAAFWPGRHFGLQGTALFPVRTRAESGGDPTPASYFDPEVWMFGVGPAVRIPTEWNRFALAPYASAGVGAKQYRWAIPRPNPTNSSLAWTLAGGIDLRLASAPQYGLLAEIRNYRSEYKWHSYQPTPQRQDDVTFRLGLSVNL